MHYVQLMVEEAIRDISDEAIAFYYRLKRRLEVGEFILCKGAPGEISAIDLLWQNYYKYDQLGHTINLWWLWVGVVTHPKTLSSRFSVGGPPEGDKAEEANNRLLKQASGPFEAKFIGGPGDSDGYVLPGKESIHPQGAIPLEVGSVAPATLLHHILRGGTFARWPYGSRFVYIFELPAFLRPIKNISDLMESHLEFCKSCKATEP